MLDNLCIGNIVLFLFQILAVAVTVCFWYRKRPDFHTFFRIEEFEIEASKPCSHNGVNQPEEQLRPSAFPQEKCSYLEKVIARIESF